MPSPLPPGLVRLGAPLPPGVHEQVHEEVRALSRCGRLVPVGALLLEGHADLGPLAAGEHISLRVPGAYAAVRVPTGSAAVLAAAVRTARLATPAGARQDVLVLRADPCVHAGRVLLGPPDLGKRAAGRACDRRKPRPDADAGVAPECEWHTPPALPAVVELQRAAAERNQVAFYDTLAAFGGVERMDAMLHLDPPLAFTDHVHLTQAGYERWAQGLLDHLLAGYAAWKSTAAATSPPPRPPSAP